jgi:DNA-binding NtrC family response regulator
MGLSLSAMPHDLLESELFGHERGAYTGAIQGKKGLLELADGGTLFLDDIDDVPPSMQAKLLRVLESQELMRVGGTRTIRVDVRFIAASKVDLREWMRRGRFRADLYYRLSVFPVDIPPLRLRRDDIPLLVQHFLSRFRPDRPIAVTAAAMRGLTAHSWPGNVRELRNVVQRIAVFADRCVDVRDLPPELLDPEPAEGAGRECSTRCTACGMAMTDVISCLETRLLRHALDESRGNQTQAARLLGLNPSTFRDKLRKYGLMGPAPATPSAAGPGLPPAVRVAQASLHPDACSYGSASYPSALRLAPAPSPAGFRDRNADSRRDASPRDGGDG